jgi:hypothetical protein
MTPNIRYLVHEALSLYKKARKYADWDDRIIDIFEEHGWHVNHPGVDKRIAKKGNVVAKWIGNCNWSDNAIRDELDIHREFKKHGLREYLPKMYAHRGNTLIVEQFLNGTVRYSVVESLYDVFLKAGVEVTDLHSENVKAFMGRPKVIDGRIGSYCGEDGNNSYSNTDDEEYCCTVDEGVDENF